MGRGGRGEREGEDESCEGVLEGCVIGVEMREGPWDLDVRDCWSSKRFRTLQCRIYVFLLLVFILIPLLSLPIAHRFERDLLL